MDFKRCFKHILWHISWVFFFFSATMLLLSFTSSYRYSIEQTSILWHSLDTLVVLQFIYRAAQWFNVHFIHAFPGLPSISTAGLINVCNFNTAVIQLHIWIHNIPFEIMHWLYLIFIDVIDANKTTVLLMQMTKHCL